MYTDNDLTAAVQAGIFTESAVTQFRRAHAPASFASIENENFRLLSGFNDIFVVIAALLVLISVGWLGSQISTALGFTLTAAIAWGLSLHFVLKKRLALPAIIFLLSFVGSATGAASFALKLLDLKEGLLVLGVMMFALAAAYLHWLKFKVPITPALFVGTLIAGVLPLLMLLFDGSKAILLCLFLLAGIATFALAMRWDAQDTARLSRQSDVAFWLHLLSAPLIAHPIFSMMNIFQLGGGWIHLAVVLVLYALFAIVSLVIDRKALLVSSLFYVVYAFATLFKDYGLLSFSFAVAGALIGTMLLILSVYWLKGRQYLFRWIPSRFKPYLPPIASQTPLDSKPAKADSSEEAILKPPT